jgi:hypothetical protein
MRLWCCLMTRRAADTVYVRVVACIETCDALGCMSTSCLGCQTSSCCFSVCVCVPRGIHSLFAVDVLLLCG